MIRPLLVSLAVVAGCTVPIAVGSSSGTASNAPTSGPSTMTESGYRRMEAEVVAELNAARTNPAAYASVVGQLLPYFNGRVLNRPGWRTPVQTQEGAAAVQEAVISLRAQPRVPALGISNGLAGAARDLANDQRNGAIGHTGSDGSTPATRISRYGTWGTSYAENVGYAPFTNGREVVVDLIVDDGVPDRGHRRNVFDPSARLVGVWCGPHRVYGSVCVIDQVAAFTPRAQN